MIEGQKKELPAPKMNPATINSSMVSASVNSNTASATPMTAISDSVMPSSSRFDIRSAIGPEIGVVTSSAAPIANEISPTELFLPVSSYATTLCAVNARCTAVNMKKELNHSTRYAGDPSA